MINIHTKIKDLQVNNNHPGKVLPEMIVTFLGDLTIEEVLRIKELPVQLLGGIYNHFDLVQYILWLYDKETWDKLIIYDHKIFLNKIFSRYTDKESKEALKKVRKFILEEVKKHTILIEEFHITQPVSRAGLSKAKTKLHLVGKVVEVFDTRYTVTKCGWYIKDTETNIDTKNHSSWCVKCFG